MICTGPWLPENISVSETWSDQGYRYPPLLSSPFPAKWITCPSQVISSVVCKHSLRIWYPFILQGEEGYCKFGVIPKNTTQWPARSRTWRGKQVLQANRLIEIRKRFSPPSSKKGNNSENQQVSYGQTFEQQTKQPSKNAVSFLTVYSR